jgi:hypothetical protein
LKSKAQSHERLRPSRCKVARAFGKRMEENNVSDERDTVNARSKDLRGHLMTGLTGR